jgi:phosphatidylglycerol:prolipoprotein diacylglycerol transferase
MWPALVRIPLPEFLGGGHFPIRMFGVMVIFAFLAGTWLITRRLRAAGVVREGKGASAVPGEITSEQVFDFCFYLLAVGILGSRLCYVLQNFGDFRGKIHRILYIWEGGLVWYGGFALAAVFAFWWTWKRKLPVLKMTDAAALGVALALAVGRWGCFFAGDDYGEFVRDEAGEVVEAPAEAPWYALRFPKGGRGYQESEVSDWRYLYSETPPSHQDPYYVHPVQLYMSAKNLVVLAVLLLVAKRSRRTGTLTAAYLLSYPVARFVVEEWRGDADRGTDVLGTGLSFSQFFGIFPFCAGFALLRHVRRQPADLPDPSRPS